MSQERRNPLPVGRYWIDLQQGKLDLFRQWADSNPTRVTVELFKANGDLTFCIFRVSAPLNFDQLSFGFPTIAGQEIQGPNDTVSRPPEVTPGSVISDAIEPLTTAISNVPWYVKFGGILLGLAVVASYLPSRLFERKNK